MHPVTVGGFAKNIISLVDRLEIPYERHIVIAYITREHNLLRNTVLGKPGFDRSGSEKMAHVGEPYRQFITYLKFVPVF